MKRDRDGSNIPAARELLVKALQFGGMNEQARSRVEEALGLLNRAAYARDRAPATSVTVNARLAGSIRAYAKAHPELSLQKIAEHFGTNSGRVSEALHGLR